MNKNKHVISKKFPMHNALMQKTKYFFMAAAFLMFTSVCFAQDELPDPGCPDCSVNTDIPFDGGVGVLVAAGVAYGIKKRYDSRKKDSSIEERNAI
jgi:hypothetical protein